ncbi:DMT family transporter [Novosphingobium colocasiae]|uniref:Membrane protein n=1 Tax=Novosphingobium colocasiae TaxID=1256513 RepID=A0A918PCM3_9SPHN|nr:DMT family transporter [Novosphingobium colocasiae]GGY99530.1 membrane protein [Novosphingobium colocasiae]
MFSGPQPAYAGIMALTGIGIPVMAALNAGLGQRLGNPAAAASVLFAVAFLGTLTAFAIGLGSGATVDARGWGGAPVWSYGAGLFVAFYVLAITAIGPRFGIGNAVFFVLVGQLASAAVIDHFGLFGAARSEITLPRLAGVILMAAGVFLARKQA